jgi:hypothetical protein
MKLIEIIDGLDSIDDDRVIFVANNDVISEDTDATIGSIQNYVETWESPLGMKYFLEVSLAK